MVLLAKLYLFVFICLDITFISLTQLFYMRVITGTANILSNHMLVVIDTAFRSVVGYLVAYQMYTTIAFDMQELLFKHGK